MRTRLPLLIALLLVPGCARVRADEPIYLIPEPAFPYWAIGDLSDAAEDWNLDLGTQLKVATTSPAHSQVVPVRASALLCGFWPAEVTYTEGVELRACPTSTGFSVFRHELGHVLNIRDHASENGTVMASGRSPDDFTDTDRRMFAEANPGFVGRGGCDVIRRLGRVQRPPRLLEVGGRVIAMLPQAGQIRLQPLDENDASPRAGAVVLPIPGGTDPLVFRTPSGIGLIWVHLGRAQIMRIDGRTLEPSGFGALALSGLGERRVLRAALELDGALLVLIDDRERATSELFRVDRREPSGEAQLLYFEQSCLASQLAERQGKAAILAVHEDSSASVVEVDVEGRVGPRLMLPGQSWDRQPREQPPAVAASERGELFMISNRFRVNDLEGEEEEPPNHTESPEENEPVGVERIFTEVLKVSADAELTAAEAEWVELPGDTHPASALEIATLSSGVIVTVTASRPLSDVSQTRDVYVMRVDGSPLRDRSGWKRISAPQGAWANAGSIAAIGDRLIAIWYDGLLRLDAEAKARCLPVP